MFNRGSTAVELRSGSIQAPASHTNCRSHALTGATLYSLNLSPPSMNNSESTSPAASSINVQSAEDPPTVRGSSSGASLLRPNRNGSGRNPSVRFSPNGEERLYVHKMLHDSTFWELPKNQQDRQFQNIMAHVRADLNAPLRPNTRNGLSLKYIKTLIKNMPRFIVEKRKRFAQKISEICVEGEKELSDSELEVSLTKGEGFDLKMLRMAEAIVSGQQTQVENSGDNADQVMAGASKSRKRREDRRVNSQRAYAKRKKKAQKVEAENENRLRLSEYRSEKLLTATVNDGRQTTQLLAGLVKIIGTQSGLNESQLDSVVGDVTPVQPIADPPEPELIEIKDSGSSSEAEDDGDNSVQENEVGDAEGEVGEGGNQEEST